MPQSQDSGKLSPTHGFKRDLVKLIGNMCYQHRLNQDEVRSLVLVNHTQLFIDDDNKDDS